MKRRASIWTTSQFPFDQRLQRIASTMEALGWDVTIWDRKTSDHPDGKIEIQARRGPLFYLEYNRSIARLVRQFKPDMVYSADIDVMPGLMWGLRGSQEIPLVLDLHEWFPEVVELESKPVRRAIWRQVERKSVAYARAVITINQSFGEIFESQYRRDVTVIRNVPWYKPTLEVNGVNRLNNKILYYQGAINAGRGLEAAIRSLHLLPDWKLWLVGDGDITHQLKTLVIDEGLTGRVDFRGRLQPDDLPGLAVNATIGLNLLDGHSRSYYYSLANKYFDYMHALLPAIHMDYPEYRSMMKLYPIGGLIADLSPAVIANKVNELTAEPDQYLRFMDHCKEARSRYHWEIESEKLAELLTSIH